MKSVIESPRVRAAYVGALGLWRWLAPIFSCL
jgi:hypothetical protein